MIFDIIVTIIVFSNIISSHFSLTIGILIRLLVWMFYLMGIMIEQIIYIKLFYVCMFIVNLCLLVMDIIKYFR